MKQRKVLVGIAIAIFRYIITLLVVGSRRYETLVVGYGSFSYAAIHSLIPTRFQIIRVYLHET